MLVLKIAKKLAVLVCLPTLAFAGSVNVELEDGTLLKDVKPITKRPSERELSLGAIMLGVSTLDDVALKFGGRALFQEGEASKSIYVRCYRGDDGTIAAFESSGEMGGKNHVLTKIAVVSKESHYKWESKCVRSTLVNKSIEAGGVRIGATKKSIEGLKGTPSKDQKDMRIYEYQYSEKGSLGEAAVNSTLILKFVKQSLIEFSVSKISSY